MADFNLTITDEGAAFLASVIANQGNIDFTEVRFSSNNYVGQESSLTEGTWAGTFITAAPSASVVDLTTINIDSSFDNSSFTTDHDLYSIGLIGDDGNTTALIAVATTSTPDIIPKFILNASTYAYNIDLAVSSTADITVSASTAGVLFVSDIVDNLNSSATNKPLSAKQGKELNDTKQTKELTTPLTIDGTTETEVEGALGALANRSGGGGGRNLLLNPWFTVNQRGVTSGSVGTTGTYLMDQWKCARLGSYTLNANGFTFAWDGVNGTNGVMRQFVEGDEIKGEDLTLSCYIDGEIKVQSFTAPSSSYADYMLTSDIGFQIDCTNAGYVIIIIYNLTTTSHTIKAVKLELGSQSTLALDTAPDYTTELLKCQRYFWRVASQSGGSSIISLGLTDDATTARAIFQTPVPMRIVPTFSYSGTVAMLKDGNTFYSVTNVTLSNTSTQSFLRLDFTSSSMAVGACVRISITNGYFDFSSEL